MNNINDKISFFIGFSSWKKPIKKFFNTKKSYFIKNNITQFRFHLVEKHFINLHNNIIFFVWGYRAPKFLLTFLQKKQIPFYYIEDGFLRSIGLGAMKKIPYSITVDSQAPYFDATRPTDLEDLLNNFDFHNNPDLIRRAKRCINSIVNANISKYNHSKKCDMTKLYGHKTKRRILVIGQVEDDASIKFGCRKFMTNADLINIAIYENPDAEIIYKPHPDVWYGLRKIISNVNNLKTKCKILDIDIPIHQAFETIDHVYTITSLSGFEALLRNIKVTTIGAPFYAGWGITNTKQSTPRRKKKLSIEEIFAASYILYPLYFDYNNNTLCDIETIINILKKGDISPIQGQGA